MEFDTKTVTETGICRDDYMKTFVFHNESHTLGNVLKSIICRYPEVEFCGYSVPHPSDSQFYLRIQTQHTVRAIDILRRGIQDLEHVCEYVLETFDEVNGSLT